MPAISYPSVGTRISTLRKAHHLTQKDLASQLHISIKHCSEVERGLCMLSLEKLAELTKIFGCTLDYLILGTDGEAINLVLPPQMQADLKSGDQRKIAVVQKYLQMYGELKE